MTPRRGARTQAFGASSRRDEGCRQVYPHELRAGDIITDESGIDWVLVGHPSKESARDVGEAMIALERRDHPWLV